MVPSFVRRYLDAFAQIEGWFSYDAALLFFVYCEALRNFGIDGDTLEIGVHHGLSAIAVAALTGPSSGMVAVDLFEEEQDQNVSGSGSGHRGIFEANMLRYQYSGAAIDVRAMSSRSLSVENLGNHFMFCHIDGGHSRSETYQDLALCTDICKPGGLIALDDYYNPRYPGVSEGAVQFMLEHPKAIRPIAIGYNKVFFQKEPVFSDLNGFLAAKLPTLPIQKVVVWDEPGILFGEPLRNYLDLQASSPREIVRKGSVPPRVLYSTRTSELREEGGRNARLDVTLTNQSTEAFPSGERVFGLSYHLLSESGQVISYDNERTWVSRPIEPGQSIVLPIHLRTPKDKGTYLLEIDLVWERVCWFKELGTPTAMVRLVVR